MALGKTHCLDVLLRPAVAEEIRRTAIRDRLPVDSITEVRMLDPYFYR